MFSSFSSYKLKVCATEELYHFLCINYQNFHQKQRGQRDGRPTLKTEHLQCKLQTLSLNQTTSIRLLLTKKLFNQSNYEMVGKNFTLKGGGNVLVLLYLPNLNFSQRRHNLLCL